MPEFIDKFFAKTSPKRMFSVTENKHFGLVFAKTGSIDSVTGNKKIISMYLHNIYISGTLILLRIPPSNEKEGVWGPNSDEGQTLWYSRYRIHVLCD